MQLKRSRDAWGPRLALEIRHPTRLSGRQPISCQTWQLGGRSTATIMDVRADTYDMVVMWGLGSVRVAAVVLQRFCPCR